MATYNNEHTGAYVYGNTVRKTQHDERRIYEDGRRVNVSERELRSRDKALQMNGGYVFFLGIISVLCLAMGVVYLGVQAEITNTREHIVSLKSDINTLTAENDARDYSITTYVSSDYIIKVAKKELGMVDAASNQVAFYKSTDSEYTIQYDDIPTE